MGGFPFCPQLVQTEAKVETRQGSLPPTKRLGGARRAQPSSFDITRSSSLHAHITHTQTYTDTQGPRTPVGRLAPFSPSRPLPRPVCAPRSHRRGGSPEGPRAGAAATATAAGPARPALGAAAAAAGTPSAAPGTASSLRPQSRHPARSWVPCQPYEKRRSRAREQDARQPDSPASSERLPLSRRPQFTREAKCNRRALAKRGRGPRHPPTRNPVPAAAARPGRGPWGPGVNSSSREQKRRPARAWPGLERRDGAGRGRGGRGGDPGAERWQGLSSKRAAAWLSQHGCFPFVSCICSAWTSPWPRRRNGTPPS
jgi:hypothetical protein